MMILVQTSKVFWQLDHLSLIMTCRSQVQIYWNKFFENHLFKSKIAYFLHFRHRYLNTYHKDFSYLNYFVLICETLSRCSDLCCHLYNSHTIHIAYDPMLKHKLHGQFGIRTTANYSIKPHHYTWTINLISA